MNRREKQMAQDTSDVAYARRKKQQWFLCVSTESIVRNVHLIIFIGCMKGGRYE
jgi:hypothetical protein